MTTFLFFSVAISEIGIISTVPFTRRNCFVFTVAATIGLGFGATLVLNWSEFVFSYRGVDRAKERFLGFAVTAFVAVILNLIDW